MAKNRYNVVVVQPRNFAVAPAMWEVARLLHYSFQSLGLTSSLQVNGMDPGAVNVLLGYQQLDNAELLQRYPTILYQLEQLSDREGWFNEKRLEILKAAREVWDYSAENVEFLRQRGVERVKLLPMGFHEKMHTIPAAQQDIDVLFYGLVNDRRKEVLQQLESRCRLTALTGVFGQERDAMIARSKIVLNLHYYEKGLLEQTRVSYLLNNGCCVVSEESTDNPYAGLIAMAPRAKLADLCLELLGDTARRQTLQRTGFEQFRRRPMVDHLKAVLEDSTALRQTPGDAAVTTDGDSTAAQPRKHTLNPVNLYKDSGYYGKERPEVLAILQRQGVRPAAVVELGCSAGGFGAKLKEVLGATHYVGVELSTNAALLAASRLDRVVVANLEEISPRELGLATGQFDLLVALDLLEHLLNPWDTLAAWAELLKPGGFVMVSIPNVQNVEIIQGLANGRWEYAVWGLLDVTHFRFFTKFSIDQLLEGAGLRVVRTECSLNLQVDATKLRDTGNNLTFGNVTISNLTREQVYQMVTYQYLVLAQKVG